MDQLKLRSLVFEKTGVRVDIDDPIFALVALNEAVLEEAVERHVALIDAASQELRQHACAAAGIAPPPAASTTPARQVVSATPAAFTRQERRLLGLSAAIAMLSALLVLGGQALFFQPAPPPPPPAEPALTAEQAAALERGAKLDKAIQKLDPKIRKQLLAELQK